MLELLEKHRGELVEIKLINIALYKKPFIAKPLHCLYEDYPSYVIEDEDKFLIEVCEEDIAYIKPLK